MSESCCICADVASIHMPATQYSGEGWYCQKHIPGSPEITGTFEEMQEYIKPAVAQFPSNTEALFKIADELQQIRIMMSEERRFWRRA